MKILITTIFDYPHEGGLSTHVSTLKNGLEARGHEVDVLSFTQLNPLFRKVYAQAPGFLLNKVKPGKGQLVNDRNRMNLLSTQLKNVKKKYDVINSQDIYAALASIESGIPTVATVHGYFSFEAISRGAILENSPEDREVQELEKQAYRNASRVVAVDKRIREYIKKIANVDAITIKNFINVSSFQPSLVDADKVKQELGIPVGTKMLFVPRRLTEKNGVIFPTLALPKVLEKHPNTVLVYAGTGEQMELIKAKKEELGIGNQLKMLGSVPHERMRELYGAADVVLVPSIHSKGVEEATSISALEAMGSGAPVVAGAVGGLKEIFTHEVDGMLVEEQNVDNLATAIIQILDDTAFGKQLADRARDKVVNEYSHLAAAQSFENIYIDAIQTN